MIGRDDAERHNDTARADTQLDVCRWHAIQLRESKSECLLIKVLK